MTRKILCMVLCCVFALHVAASSALAGGALETIDITNAGPSPIAGHLLARVIPIKWDTRCIPVNYSMNTTLDPIPNPLGAPVLSLADATAGLQASFDAWNNIPTSFIGMNITGTTGNLGLIGFDMVNELTFRTAAGFGAIASSPSVSLIADSTFVAGDDIDGDGDSDVSASADGCSDVDGDGDIEFRPGFYPAGTILDNDVQFNTKVSNGFRFTTNIADIDAVTRSVDLLTVAIHEFGHSHGLSHSLNNQIDGASGHAATMFPFIDTGDPAAELDQRVLDVDDIAWSSHFYPEGTAPFGPPRLQPGDIAFSRAFGVITGEVTHGVQNRPLAGANVFAVRTGSGAPTGLLSSGFSGTTLLSFNPATGGLFFVNDATGGIVDGRYVIPAPAGDYSVGVEATDGQPAAAGNISFTAQIGNFNGQLNFNEEFYNGAFEAALEENPGEASRVRVRVGATTAGINLVTNNNVNINPFGSRNFVGFTNAPAGSYYAVRIPGSAITAANTGSRLLIQAATFNTNIADASVPVTFAEALLTTGTANPDGTASINLASPLAVANGFIGQDNDFAPFYFDDSVELGAQVLNGIAAGTITDLFIVLRVPTTTPFPGVSALPPFIGLDGGGATNDVPIFNGSYFSPDGATFTLDTRFNFMFGLVTTVLP